MKTYTVSIPYNLSIFSSVCCFLFSASLASTATAAPPSTIRVSVSSAEIGGNGQSGSPTLSANGRFVAFESDATNLVDDDNNDVRDIFVRDLKSGLTQRISVNSAGAESNSFSFNPAISESGRFVVYESIASNLVDGDSNGATDVFEHDLKTGKTQHVSLSSAGSESNGASLFPAVSANGRFVAFESVASNLVTGDNNGARDIFVRDLKIGITRRISIDSAGFEGNNTSKNSAISANGRYVAFSSDASNLVNGDNNGTTDVFIHDLKTGETQRVSLDNAGAEGNNASYEPVLSVTGRFVAFVSDANNLVAGDVNAVSDVFVRDLKTGSIQRVSISNTGAEGNSYSSNPAFSANGRFVAFSSFADNLVSGDINGGYDVYVRDLKTHVTQRVSLTNEGLEGNSYSLDPDLSANGRMVVFTSAASNLVPGEDNNNVTDVFLRRWKN